MLFGPADLPASLEPAVCPVGNALTLIRHDALVALGGFDEGYPLGREDVDLCLRAFAAGGTLRLRAARRRDPSPRRLARRARPLTASSSRRRRWSGCSTRFDDSARRPFALELA